MILSAFSCYNFRIPDNSDFPPFLSSHLFKSLSKSSQSFETQTFAADAAKRSTDIFL